MKNLTSFKRIKGLEGVLRIFLSILQVASKNLRGTFWQLDTTNNNNGVKLYIFIQLHGNAGKFEILTEILLFGCVTSFVDISDKNRIGLI